MSLELVQPLQVSDHDPFFTDEEGAAMARAVVNLFRHWSITEEQASVLLGGISKRTYARWKEGEVARLTIDQKTRLSLLMGIHKALRILFLDKARVYAWVKKPNQAFGEKSALEIMLRGYLTDLIRVRSALDAARG